jgi:hypothetical protein
LLTLPIDNSVNGWKQSKAYTVLARMACLSATLVVFAACRSKIEAQTTGEGPTQPGEETDDGGQPDTTGPSGSTSGGTTKKPGGQDDDPSAFIVDLSGTVYERAFSSGVTLSLVEQPASGFRIEVLRIGSGKVKTELLAAVDSAGSGAF